MISRVISNLSCLLVVGSMFVGCALPKGMVTDAERTDADGGARDSGVRRVNGTTPEKPRKQGAGGAAAGSGAGGAAGDASVALTQGASTSTQDPKPKPKANGETCDSSAECLSANCKKGSKGDKRCYGSIGRGRDCNGTYECDGYSCIGRKHGETQGVCIDTSSCVQDACQQSRALAFCQLDQKCSATPQDFAKCYEDRCAGESDADAGCAEESVVQHLNEIGCCPAGGPSTGSTCGTSPQCGCAADQKCDSLRDGSRSVCGPIGSVAEYGACLKDAECQKGFSCRGHLCKRYCHGPDDNSCLKGACVAGIASENGKIEPGIFICTRSCDPTSPTTQSEKYAGCGKDQGCSPASDGNSDCYLTSGTEMQGGSCADDKDQPNGGFKCAPGFACMVSDDKCARYCKVADGACEVGNCFSFGPSKSYAGSVEIGYCR